MARRFVQCHLLMIVVCASRAYARSTATLDQETTLAEEIKRTLRSFAYGSAADDLPPMDPVHMKDISFCQSFGAVRASIQFPSSILAGVSAVDEVLSVSCSPGESAMSFTTHHSEIVQHGQYNLTGSFGDVIAVGKGDAHIVLRDVAIRHHLAWRRARGQLRVREYRGHVIPARMTVRYENLRSETRDELLDECRLYKHHGGGSVHRLRSLLHSSRWRRRRRGKRRKDRGGGKLESADVNRYFNANWRQFYDAISPSVGFAFSAVFRDYMDALLQRIESQLLECDSSSE